MMRNAFIQYEKALIETWMPVISGIEKRAGNDRRREYVDDDMGYFTSA